eukprot:311233-Pleurochrysis_carterae.AAC.1
MACPDGDMTVAERLYLMSFKDGVCGTKELTPRQVSYRVSLIHSYDHRSDAKCSSQGLGKSVRRL